MKLKLLIAFIAISLVSCSKDDDSGSDPNANPEEKKLYKIVQTEFNDNGSVKLTSKIEFDDNDRALLQLQYDGAGELNSRREFTYNGSGQVESMVFYTAETGMESPNYSYTVAYDNDGRVTEVNDSFFTNGAMQSSVMSYLYNPNNSIILTRTFSFGGSDMITYYVNSSGQVYKKTGADGINEEIIYSGENILNYTNGSTSSVFEYDNERTPKGQQHIIMVKQYNDNMVNSLMLNGLMSIALGKTKYAIKRTDSDGNTYDYEYQYDEEGYPIKLRCFKNDASMPFSIREISYK